MIHGDAERRPGHRIPLHPWGAPFGDNHEISGSAFEGNGWSAAGDGVIHHLDPDFANAAISDDLLYEPDERT